MRTDAFSLIKRISRCWKEQLESFGCPKASVYVPLASQVRVAASLSATRQEPTQEVPAGLARCPGHPFLDVTVNVPVAVLK